MSEVSEVSNFQVVHNCDGFLGGIYVSPVSQVYNSLLAQEEPATYFARHISILEQNCSAKVDQ